MLRIFFLLSLCSCVPTPSLPNIGSGEDFGYTCDPNEYGKSQWCLCKPGFKVSKISSVFDYNTWDRKWTLVCKKIKPEFGVSKNAATRVNSPWSQYDQSMNWQIFDVPQFHAINQAFNQKKTFAQFMVGMESDYNDDEYDRKFRFHLVQSHLWYLADCITHTNINDWNENFEFDMEEDEVIAGMDGAFNYDHGDRQWSLKVCKLRQKCEKISDMKYHIKEANVTSEVYFAGKSSVDNIHGGADLLYGTTISKFVANSLTESYEFSSTSSTSLETSMSISDEITVGIPEIDADSLKVTAGISSRFSFDKTWTRSSSRKYSETNGRKMSFAATCKAGCKCQQDLIVETVKGVIPYTMKSESVDGTYHCEEDGELKVDYSFNAQAKETDCGLRCITKTKC